MSDLTPRELELVALGAAMGSNCVPCVACHIRESRKVGLTDTEITAAIQHADKIRQVPARKTLEAARNMLTSAPGAMDDAGNVGSRDGGQPFNKMAGMMFDMMGACGCSDQAAGAKPSLEEKPTTAHGC